MVVGDFQPGFLPVDPIRREAFAAHGREAPCCTPSAATPETLDPRRPVPFATFLLRENLTQPGTNLPALGSRNEPAAAPSDPTGAPGPREPAVRFSDPSAARLSDRPSLPDVQHRRTIETIYQVRQPVRRGWTIDLYA